MSFTFTEEYDGSVSNSDVVPDTHDVEYPCEVCGREAGPYSGRGRKPKFCSEHKRKTTTSGPKVKGADAALAAKAAEALCQLNTIGAMLAMTAGYWSTGKAITATNDNGFREQAYNALLTDPELCKRILSAGTTSGKISLSIAYIMAGTSVVPYIVEDNKRLKTERALKREQDEVDAV